jgi:glycosyltransferase involved in cell wall biosynthesis
MNILIPAYEPSTRFINLIRELKEKCDYNIVVVDDGSCDKFYNIFKTVKELGCTVLIHSTNLGKGQALKTGFKHIMETGDETGVVCADCDGQHLPQDIIRIAEGIKTHKNFIILGTRHFTGKVPLRSSLGNSITRAVFSFASGVKVYDTQTGLRGYQSHMLPWLCKVSGDRFEYEMNLLLEAVPSGYGFHEIDIDTVYLEENKSSHFRALQDSVRVYLPILKFSLSSILAAILDFTLVILLQLITTNLFFSVAGARVFSAIFNYTMNKVYVFSKLKSSTVKHSLPRYFLLATFIMFANYGVIHIYNETIGIPLFFSKLLAEMTIFIFSFWSQRKFVFNNPVKIKGA